MTDLIVKYCTDTDDLQFGLFQDDGETGENLNLFTNICVLLTTEKYDLKTDVASEIVAKYAMNAKTGYNTTDFHIVDGDAGEVKISIQNAIIEAMKPGIYKTIFQLYKTDSNYTDGYQIETLEEVYLERR